jgi:hypothetical protein
VTTSWTIDPPGARVSEVYCRGCSKPIWRLDTPTEMWEDADGITACVKARLEDIGHGQRPDYVLHQPMPAGLVGAPT